MFLCVNCFYQHHKKMFAFYGHIFFFFIVTLSPSLRQTLHVSFLSRIKWPFCFFSVFMATRLSFLTAALCLSVLLNSVTFFHVCKVFLCASSFLPGSFFSPLSLSLFVCFLLFQLSTFYDAAIIRQTSHSGIALQDSRPAK